MYQIRNLSHVYTREDIWQKQGVWLRKADDPSLDMLRSSKELTHAARPHPLSESRAHSVCRLVNRCSKRHFAKYAKHKK